ncbi:MAG TPA: hypothetical protein VL404_09815 [Candidatus Eisenbacteria bacterium]|nr:hypothetical protein [Candidatus Eisenbacteria bacterium]
MKKSFRKAVLGIVCPSAFEHKALDKKRIAQLGAEIVVSGMGKVRALYACAEAKRRNPGLKSILLIGFAGGLTADLEIGDVVEPDTFVEHDYDARPFEKYPNVLKFPPKRLVPGSKRVTMLTQDHFLKENPHADGPLSRKFGALACDMESYAVAHFCRVARVRLAVVKLISDSADESADHDFLKACRRLAPKLNRTVIGAARKLLALAVFFILSAAPARAAVEPVRVLKNDSGAWEMRVGDKPYFIKGVVFSPVKIGESPSEATMRDWMTVDDDGDGVNDVAFQTWVDQNGDGRRDPEETVGDFELLRRMGCNTIRLYHVPSDNPILGDLYKKDPSTKLQFDHPVNKPLLRRLYSEFGIRVIMGNFLGSWTIGSGASWEEGTDYANPAHREAIKRSVRAMVLDNKDEPYVLFWLLGNENNIASWSKSNANKEPEAYARLVGELADMIHELDPDHPVGVSEGDPGNTYNLANYAKHAPGIDLIGYNSYRGKFGFDFLWKQVRRTFDRPVVITEFGIFAYDSAKGEDEELQAGYLERPWRDIASQTNSLGGVVFDWADRWYMDGTPSEHNPGTRHWPTSPDLLDHEEWFGLFSRGDGSDPLFRRPRQAYRYLARVWSEPKK